MTLPEERKRQVSNNTYLVCPLRDDELEAIRAGAYKFREENFPQEHKQAKQSIGESSLIPQETGEFIKATDDPLLSTQFVRRELYWQLNREQMQRAVARYYGWDKWSEDPWGSYPKFCEWISNTPDNEMAVWAVNETSKGRYYLVRSILKGLAQLDYSETTEKDLLTQIGYGAAAFLHVKHYTGWEDFFNNYPTEPLPVRLVNERVSKVYPFDLKLSYPDMTFPLPRKPNGSLDIPERVPKEPFEGLEDLLGLFIDARNYGPFTGYRFLVSSIYLWSHALREIGKRTGKYPEIAGIIGYKTDSDSYIAELCKRIAHKDYRLPDRSTSIWAIWEVVLPSVHPIYKKYLYPLHEGLPNTDAGQKGLIKLDTKVKELAQERIAKIVIAGLTEALRNALRDEVQRGVDTIRKSEERRLSHEITIEGNTTLFDRIATSQLGPEPMPEEPIDLKGLGLNIDALTPKELLAIERLVQALKDGYSLDSKKGQSLRQYFGDDYQKIMRAFNRAKAKLKKP